MKRCQICGKPAVELTTVLRNGPRGYRRYATCDKCLKGSNAKAKTEGKNGK